LLAGVSAVAGESIDAFAAMNITLAAMALAVGFAAARRIVPAPVALGALAMAAANPFLQGIAGTVMSESAFLAFIALTLWALSRAPLTPRDLVVACVVATLAALTRTVGATLILSVLALLVLERRWRPAAVYGGLLLLVIVGVSFWLRSRAMPDLAADYITEAAETADQSARNPLAVVGSRVIANAPRYAGTLLWVLSVPTIGGTIIDNLLWLVIACGGLAAGLLVFWRRWKIVTVFAVIYGALILAWPWVIGRFLVPLLPLLAVAFLTGANALLERRNARIASAVVIALAAVIAITGFGRAASKIAVRSRCDREQAMQSPSCFNADQLAFFAAARYVAEHAPPSSIVMSANEGTFFYVGRRPVVPVDSITARPPDQAAKFLHDEKVAYAVIGHVGVDSPAFAERLLSACDHLDPIAEFPPRTTVFRVLPSATPQARACEILRDYRQGAGDFLPQIF
jgi:hypothetical protein